LNWVGDGHSGHAEVRLPRARRTPQEEDCGWQRHKISISVHLNGNIESVQEVGRRNIRIEKEGASIGQAGNARLKPGRCSQRSKGVGNFLRSPASLLQRVYRGPVLLRGAPLTLHDFLRIGVMEVLATVCEQIGDSFFVRFCVPDGGDRDLLYIFVNPYFWL